MREKLNILPVLCFVTGIFTSSMATASPMWLGEKYDVRASSELKSDKNSYAAKKVIPPSLGTAWCEGAEGDGVGEWIELNLKEPMISDGGFKLEILPGFVVSSATYKKNNRPRKISVTVNDDSTEKQLTLEDYGKFQSFFFEWSGKPVKKIRLKILEVYKGEQYADTCITDIAVWQWSKNEHDMSGLKAWLEEQGKMRQGINLAKMNRDSLSFLMGSSESRYYSPDGGESNYEDYLESFMHNPGLFLWVLDKQSDAVLKNITKAIVSPINDEYPDADIRRAVLKGLDHLDIGLRNRLKPLFEAPATEDQTPD